MRTLPTTQRRARSFAVIWPYQSNTDAPGGSSRKASSTSAGSTRTPMCAISSDTAMMRWEGSARRVGAKG
eukprot:11228303-Lingulodinium_polyedra.AAC.4